MLDMVECPKDWFSRVSAHIVWSWSLFAKTICPKTFDHDNIKYHTDHQDTTNATENNQCR